MAIPSGALIAESWKGVPDYKRKGLKLFPDSFPSEEPLPKTLSGYACPKCEKELYVTESGVMARYFDCDCGYHAIR
jgi:hypothetical protein